ncbi:Crp/Fnr family transcriptional regulator [Aquimarina rhabdastrellae]
MLHPTSDLFNHTIIEQDFKHVLLKYGNKQCFTQNNIILSPYNSSSHIGFITKGVIKVTFQASEKEFFLFYLNAKNNFIINDINIMLETPLHVSYTAATDVKIYWVPKSLFDKWITDFPMLKNLCLLTAQANLDSILEKLASVNSFVLKDRLFNFLRESALQLETDTLKILTKTLANNLNSSSQSISRALNQLEKELKIQRSHKKITICNYY